MRTSLKIRAVLAVATVFMATSALAQESGAVRGIVTLGENSTAAHGAVVLLVGSGQVATTDERGAYAFSNVPPGEYQILAQRESLTAARQNVTVVAGADTAVDVALVLSPVHEEVTVTATTGGTATNFETFNSTSTLDSFDLVADPVGNLGQALEGQAGVAMRSFGPGASRPIIRGFDGDRVLIMEDGIRNGDLSSQSGDHGINTDPAGLDRLEIVRGPATLLYGSNAVGGVVNAITPQEQFRTAGASGTQGQLSFDAGSANGQAGTFASVQHGQDNFQVWAGGGSRRTEDYQTPEGAVENSKTRLSTGRAGVAYAGDRFFASGGFTLEDGRNGTPFAGEFHGHHEEEEHEDEGDHDEEEGEHEEELLIDIDSRRRVGRFDFGMRDLSTRIVESFQVVLNVIDWEHDELDIEDGLEAVGTTFANRSYVVRADINQAQAGRLSGRFGFWGQVREFSVVGEEALSPATDQTSFAAFAYEEVDFGRLTLQFGGRVERNDYSVGEREGHHEEEEGHHEEEEGHHEEEEGGHGDLEPGEARDRDFTGGSASFGAHVDLGAGNAFVANLTRSYRAPALEELYFFGAHPGNLVFEVGNPDLDSESTVGLDFSLRHQSAGARGSVNFYVYDIDNFVFFDRTTEIVDNLQVANVLQGDSRFVGVDAQGSVRLGSRLWANVGLGFVDAELKGTNEPLPRIPPLRARFSLDIPYGGFTVSPEVVFSSAQDSVFRDETTTDSYSLLNLRASYVWSRSNVAHIVTVSGFNLTDELYRSHTSFIKDLAPDIGRGVRVGYSMRFF